jgi:NADH:ubiquinone reductase (H+-translocating)
MSRVLVLGGGYAGVLAANRIAGRLGRHAQVTLISDRDHLVHRIRLHEVIAGRPWRRYPLAGLVRRRVALRHARVARIDRARGLVELASGDAVAWDQLVIALGSRVTLEVPGAAQHAGGLADLDAALALRARIAELPAGAPVVVIGGGLTGIEAASELAEAYPQLAVTLVAPVIAPSLSALAQAYVRDVLADLGVAVIDGARVADVAADHVALGDGRRLAARAALWAAGFTGALPCAADLPLDAAGRVEVDAELAVPGAPGVWAIGDAAAPPPGMEFLRMACATAMPLAAHAADNLACAVRGRPPAGFRFGFAGQCVSLGRRRGVFQRCDPRDAPTGPVYTGRTGALLKELICRYVIGALRIERRLAGAYQWPRALRALPPGDPADALSGAILR